MAIRRGFRHAASIQPTPPRQQRGQRLPPPPVVATGQSLPANMPSSQRLLPELTADTVRLLLGRDDANILEIGANDGSDTKEFLQAFPNGRITCFECDPRAIAGWRKRIARDSRAVLHQTALGDTAGTMQFHQSGGRPPGKEWANIRSWDKSGSLLKPDRHTDYAKWLTFPGVIEVPVTTLDIWRGEDDSIIDFVWIDCQGAEAMVLRGGQKTVPKIRWFYTECHARPYYHGQATLGELQALLPGFVVYSSHKHENFLFRNTALP